MALYARRLLGLVRNGKDKRPLDGTLAQAYPLELAACTLLCLLIAVVFNKVFSPQYLLWLLPLVALVPYRRLARRLFLYAFLLACALTTVLFPYLYYSDLVGLDFAPPHRWVRGPSTLGVVLLCGRNLLMLGLVVAMMIAAARRRPETRNA